MSASGTPIDPEILLANVRWMHRLARGLLADDHSADDVVQATLAAAVERPPREDVPLRPWLARVARNFALQVRRSESRRSQREAIALPRGAATDDPLASAARTETFVALTAAVRALDPIYRDVVVLHFFDDLDMHAAAARLGVPVETARTRLKRALALLRERLDRDHGGDGRTWALALLPVAAAPGAGSVGESAATQASQPTAAQRSSFARGTAAAAAGGLVMAGTAKWAGIAAVAGALVGALVTAGTMSVASTTGDDETTKSVRRTDASGRTPGGDALPGRSSDAEARTRASGASRRHENPSTSRADLAAWLDGVDVELPAPGTGTISGRVTMEDGRAVPGVVVRATLPRTGVTYRRGVVPPVLSVEESVLESAREAKWRVATTREAVTDADGRYTLTGVTQAAHRFGAWGDGLEVRLQSGVNSNEVRPGDTVDFVANEIVMQPVVVVLPDGTRPERAQVQWSLPAGGGGSSSRWTTKEPFVQPAPGTWKFTATVDDESKSQPVTATLTTGVPAEPITLRLEVRNRLQGKVRLDPADAAWENVHVELRPVDGTPKPRRDNTGTRPPDWAFRFDDLAAGEYDLTARIDDWTPLVTTRVRVVSGTVIEDLVVPRLTAAQCLQVRVTARDGTPLPADDVTFGINERSARLSTATGARSVRRGDGLFLVALRAPGALEIEMARRERENAESQGGGVGGAGGGAAGADPPLPQPDAGPSTWFLRVQAKSRGVKEVEFTPGTTTQLDVSFE